MTVSSNSSHGRTVNHQQHSVQVVANVLLRHRKVHHAEQVLQRGSGQRKIGGEFCLCHRRKFFGRQRLQVETALAAGDRHFLVRKRQLHVGVGQRPQNVDQFARRDRGRGSVIAGTDVSTGLNLNFQISRSKRHFAAFLAHQNVREDRQRLPAFDDTAYHLQRF